MTEVRQNRLSATLLAIVCLVVPGFAADHGDGPLVSGTNRTADIGDAYIFLDPNDNDFLVLAMTVQGFIVPSEAVNFSVFDPTLEYRFELETNGNAMVDRVATVRFSPKDTASSDPQTATIRIPRIVKRFKAPTTVSTLADTSPTPVVTTDQASGVSFFAGEVDDPFPFDIVGFGRFVASVLAGAPDATQLARGRDSFAGYNTLGIALRIPVAALGDITNDTIGLGVTTVRGKKQLDRMGNPGINVALVPFPRKDAYNEARPKNDAKGKFAASIAGTLTALGTSPANIDVLAGIGISNGDLLRLDLSTPNTGTGGGTNPEAAFPNGRRLGDDVIDTIIAVVTNGAITTGDNVVLDKPLANVFPFFAATHQPFPSGTVDDLTRN
jgi:hypothetical protein